MKTVLVAINAKYIHSNLAVHNLMAYAKKYEENISILEFTINHNLDAILSRIYQEKPDVIAFSCYIWNITMVHSLAAELKKIIPFVKVWLGGPEVSYESYKLLEKYPSIDLVMVGEGEETFLELQNYYVAEQGKLLQIEGLVYRDDEGNIITTKPRNTIDLSDVPFIYDDMDRFQNKIIYYESSRGCPYSCSYCLSSLDKRVRFRDIGLVKEELKKFLDAKVKQVKFVDRTFNAKHSHAMEIWKFLKENDNGITNFHFEISADILSEEELSLLKTLRPGQIQFEIGVQSTNPDTIKAIRRKMDFECLKKISKTIASFHNIHQHLDLIVGLPYEDFNSFEKSFADVYSLRPEQLQMGFLKVLKGSYMEECVKEYGIVYRDFAPYEVLKTNFLSFEEVIILKGIEEMVEIYYNSGQFTYSIQYLESFYDSPMKMYQELSGFYIRSGLDNMAHSRMKRYELLLDFFQELIQARDFVSMKSIELFQELLVYDLYLREKLKNRPNFAKSDADLKQILRDFYFETGKNRSTTHIEEMEFDVKESIKQGQPVRRHHFVLFDYENRDALDYSAQVVMADEIEELKQ